ncbi:CD2 antigen cytoplasmic tail-binding 2 [Brachionus plicatilis]|uniref:CD2 antigen cytoplasmic tail-binding 2 n=1 Tax=Brachionus plicatilis TaxID=10195 RepID=A0A3M7S3L7_BRAPC|nr:CD2 antigen cytoplasmic tail-binding 2 [Brachionus plicatilis]
MPVKKRVKFDNKKEYKHYTKESESDLSDNGDESKQKTSHSLDSDEEENIDKYKPLNREVLADIGQESKTSEFDDEIKLTPFNMKEELEEGDFDTEGHYHWKRNKNEIKDAWLDNIDWANINSFKKSYQLHKQSGDTEDESSESEAESMKVDDEEEKIELFKKILPHLQMNETILRAIKRLGNSSKTGSSASQRWQKKKIEKQESLSEKALADKEALENLTGYANQFIDKGFYDIYEETYQSLEKKIKEHESKSSEPLDIFADEVNEKEIQASTSNTETRILEDKVVKWLYKENNIDDAKIYGPFTSQEMLDKAEKGEFKETGVWCRRCEDASGTFYNSKRIDFDLYT